MGFRRLPVPSAIVAHQTSRTGTPYRNKRTLRSRYCNPHSANCRHQELFAPHAKRADLLDEMSGLSWSLGVVNLRPLLAFQRRLSFDPAMPRFHIPARHDCAELIALSFGPAKPIDCKIDHNHLAHTTTVQSTNPNLHFRTGDDTALPVSIHAGGPFLEVAHFQNRWFLRDGYHRAYALLQAGIFEVPAVLVETKTIEELGAAQPWFFSEQVLFSNDPPRVLDFLNDEFVIEYQRPPLIKTLRLTMTETLTPAHVPGEPA